MLLVLTGVVFLTLLHIVDKVYFSNSIEQNFFRSVEDTLRGTKRAIHAKEAWKHVEEVEDLAIPNDLSVLYIQEDEVRELNRYLESTEFSSYLQSDFLFSQQGQNLLEDPSDRILRLKNRDYGSDFRYVYVLLDFLDGENNVLLLAKDMTSWRFYLINSTVFFFVLIVLFLLLIFYFYTVQQRRVYDPVLEITEVAYQYSENNFQAKVSVKSNDEISNLATAVMKLGKALEANSIMNSKEKDILEHVFDSLAIGIIYIDEDYKITSLNEIGQLYYETYIRESHYSIQEELRDHYQKAIEMCFQTGAGQRMEVQQNQMFFDIRFSPTINEKNEVAGVLLLVEEITHAKRMAAIREELITNVSHDFRTPLSTIMGYSEAILDEIAETVEEKNEMAKVIHEEAAQLNQMINSLLNLSRLKAGYAELDFQIVRIDTFFENIFSRFSDTLSKENIALSLEIEEGLETFQIDEERMHHAVYNLIDNAIRYAADPRTREQRSIHIEVKLDSLLDQVLIKVQDNGIGISEASIPFIFERFYKDDKARSRPKNDGSGIGLSLVYSIIQKHGGKIEVESKLEEGTTFTIRLPFQLTTYGEIEEISN